MQQHETETHNVTINVKIDKNQRQFIQNLAQITGLTERQTTAALIISASNSQPQKQQTQNQ